MRGLPYDKQPVALRHFLHDSQTLRISNLLKRLQHVPLRKNSVRLQYIQTWAPMCLIRTVLHIPPDVGWGRKVSPLASIHLPCRVERMRRQRNNFHRAAFGIDRPAQILETGKEA